MSRVFVITGPSGVGKGTLIRLLRERLPELGLSVSATTRAPRAGEEQDGVDYHFLSDAEFDRLIAEGAFVEHAEYAGRRYGTLRTELERRAAAGEPVVLEIEVQGARQVRESMPDAVQVFIAPPSPEALRERLVGRGTDAPEDVERRLRVAADELAAKDEFQHVVVNDRLRGRRGGAGGHRAGRHRRTGRIRHMIQPRIDTLLEHVDSNYAASSSPPSARARSTATTTTSARGRSTSSRRRWSTRARKNYLTIALEEVAAGKITYHYR